MSSVNGKFAQALVRLRGEQSLYEVSKAIGIHRAALHRYEQGKRVPEDKNLELIAAFYKVDIVKLKMLIFEDWFPEGSQDRQILFQWLKQLESENLG